MAKRVRQTTPASRPPAPTQPAPISGTDRPVSTPGYAQPEFMPDPTQFVVRHASDTQAYQQIDALNRAHGLLPMAFPPARGGVEPVLTLAEVLGAEGVARVASIQAAGRLVFHAVGDTGNTRSTEPQNLVSDKLATDFEEADPADIPNFFFHLGDVIYSFGESAYYYDQFYEPYRNYPAPILALAGNHDGMVAPGAGAASLAAFLQNFCADHFVVTAEAGGLSRTAQIQPGVYFTFEAPFLRIIALYSNTLEDPGVLSSQNGKYPIPDTQLAYLRAALLRIRNLPGALIITHHHPAFTAGAKHGWSVDMTAEIDAICAETGVWPHAVLSAHAHNYQRFTRARGDAQVPYIIAGNGGHGIAKLVKKGGAALRVPQEIQAAGNGVDSVVLESYDDQDYGYLRIIADPTQLRIEYHPATDGGTAKTPDDSVAIDLKTRRMVHYTGTSGSPSTPAATSPAMTGRSSALSQSATAPAEPTVQPDAAPDASTDKDSAAKPAAPARTPTRRAAPPPKRLT